MSIPLRKMAAPAVALGLSLMVLQSGCVVACGARRCPPPQKVHILAPDPGSCTIRVVDVLERHFDTPVGAEGRVDFDVPVYSRHCTQFLFGLIKIQSPTPVEERRVIWVMRGEKVLRKLSAADIAKLPADGEGYHLLDLEAKPRAPKVGD